MGARSTFTFTGDATPEAAEDDSAHIYLHWGGESQEECEDTIRAFFAALASIQDTRASDPSYLAAKFVAWQADGARYPKDAPVMEFLSVGIVGDRMDGADYGVVFCCGDLTDGLPAAYTAPDTQSTELADYERFALVSA